jgi:hypothetical protein
MENNKQFKILLEQLNKLVQDDSSVTNLNDEFTSKIKGGQVQNNSSCTNDGCGSYGGSNSACTNDSCTSGDGMTNKGCRNTTCS